MPSMKYLFALAVMATLASTAFAVHCYQCESTLNSKCGEHFMADESMKVDCSRIPAPLYTQALMVGRSTNATGCMKKTLQKAVGQPYTLRTCYHGDLSNTRIGCEMDPQNAFVKQLSCDVCSGNLCNGSSSMAPVALAVVAFFALARIFS